MRKYFVYKSLDGASVRVMGTTSSPRHLSPEFLLSSPLCLGVTPIPGDQPPGKLVPINTLSGSCSADHSSLPLSSRQSGVLRHKVCNHYNRGKVFSFYLNFKYNPNQEEEMCPALFNNRLSSYWIHKLNCCFTSLNCIFFCLSCCGNTESLSVFEGTEGSCAGIGHTSLQAHKTNIRERRERGERCFVRKIVTTKWRAGPAHITSKHSIQVGI